MEWEDFYVRFYGWAESTQRARISDLTSFGPSEEVTEIACSFFDEKAAGKLLKKAIAGGVRFTPEEIVTLADLVTPEIQEKLLFANASPYQKEDIEELCDVVDDDLLLEIARKYHIRSELLEDTLEAYAPVRPQKRSGGFLAVLLGLASGFSGKSASHSAANHRRCNGDCANCPPHYGYRYGRWYYGHCHQYGCEFGGNKGDGSMD